MVLIRPVALATENANVLSGRVEEIGIVAKGNLVRLGAPKSTWKCFFFFVLIENIDHKIKILTRY